MTNFGSNLGKSTTWNLITLSASDRHNLYRVLEELVVLTQFNTPPTLQNFHLLLNIWFSPNPGNLGKEEGNIPDLFLWRVDLCEHTLFILNKFAMLLLAASCVAKDSPTCCRDWNVLVSNWLLMSCQVELNVLVLHTGERLLSCFPFSEA